MLSRKLKTKRAIVFDWDGTLFNSMGYKRDNAVRLFVELGATTDKVIPLHKKFSGLPRKELFLAIHSALFNSELSPGLYLELSKRYTEMNIEGSVTSTVFSDVEPTIDALSHHFLLFVSSSSAQDELSIVTSRQSIFPAFQSVFGSEAGFRKGKEHFAHIKSKWNLRADELLFLGDDEQDGVLASQGNIDFFLIARKENHKSHHSTLAALTDLLSHLDL